MTSTRTYALLCATALLCALLVYSGVYAFDRATWALEVFPVFIAAAVMTSTYRRFPLTTLLYVCIFLHAVVLIIGGAYTYARVPLGFQLAELLHIERNPYDKIGHLFQGFVPALAAREILIRGAYVNGRRMLDFIIVCIVLAISAAYELIEWGVAEMFGAGAEDFLGTQGYVWDTQSDMLMALIGSLLALMLVSRLHDRQIATVERKQQG